MLSRMAKNPLIIPSGVEVVINGSTIEVKGPLGQLKNTFNDTVTVSIKENTLVLNTNASTKFAKALSGTVRAILNNMILGVTKGFEKKLTILGVGYRAAVQGNQLNLTIGYSHPVNFVAPNGIKLETPLPTEILVKGIDKQVVGQMAATIRRVRSVEPYKGKGIRYADEVVVLKETKKK